MVALIIAYILNIIDYLFTHYWVNLYGLDIEANPFGRWMLENNVAWIFKIVVVGLLFAVIGHLIKRCAKVAFIVFIPLAVYGLIVLYHLGIFVYIKSLF